MTPPLRLGPGGEFRRDVWRFEGGTIFDWLAALLLLAGVWWVLT